MSKTFFEGNQFRIRIEIGKQGVNCSSGLSVQIESEDDGYWFAIGSPFDALWLSDLLTVVKTAFDFATANLDKRKKKAGRGRRMAANL